MQKSLKSRRVRPHGKHARFQETTIAFQLKENKRLVKESRTAYTPPNPPSARAPPKRYVHSLVEPRSPRFAVKRGSVCTGEQDGFAWLSDREGRWRSTAYCWLVVFLSHSAQSGLVCTASLCASSWVRSKYCLGVRG